MGGLLALVNVFSLMFTPLIVALTCMALDLDVIYHMIQLVLPFLRPFHILLLHLLRFCALFHGAVELIRLASFKILSAIFVFRLRVSCLLLILKEVRFVKVVAVIKPSLFVYQQMSLLNSFLCFQLGKQFLLVLSFIVIALISIGFMIIRLNHAISFQLMLFLMVFYVAGIFGSLWIFDSVNGVDALSDKFIRTCQLKAIYLPRKKLWRVQMQSLRVMKLSVGVGYIQLFSLKRSTAFTFFHGVSMYTLNAILSVP